MIFRVQRKLFLVFLVEPRGNLFNRILKYFLKVNQIIYPNNDAYRPPNLQDPSKKFEKCALTPQGKFKILFWSFLP